MTVSNTFNVSVVSPTTNPPSWVSTAISNGWAVNTWLRISGNSGDLTAGYGLTATNHLRTVKTVNQSDTKLDGILDEWCGGFHINNVGTYGYIGCGLGGGHAGYAGNDVFIFDLGTRTWSQLCHDTASSGTLASPASNGELTDGSPLGSHNASWWYYDSIRKEIGMPKSWWNNGEISSFGSAPRGHALNVETALAGYVPSQWRRNAQDSIWRPSSVAFSTTNIDWANVSLAQQIGCAYNPNDGYVYSVNTATGSYANRVFWRYKPPPTDQAEFLQDASGGADNTGRDGSSMSVDTTHNVMVAWAFDVPHVSLFDLNQPTTDWWYCSTPPASGAINERNNPVWIASHGAFYTYGGYGGGERKVYKITYTGPSTPTFTPGGSNNYTLSYTQIDTGTVTPTTQQVFNDLGHGNGVHNAWQVAQWGTTVVGFLMSHPDRAVNAFLIAV